MNWIAANADREQTMGRLPGIGVQFQRLYASFYRLPQLPPEIVEMCRLRLAQLHRSEADFALEEYPLASDRREQLQHWHRAASFSAGERACLELAEVYAMDCGAVTDAQADAVKEHFGEAGLVALLQALGVFDGFIRLGLIWRAAPVGGRQHD
ncbi:MAG: hypothetical protein RJQ10_05955 [Haliea sp.]|uniref:carboxymuconolactone decarboxylase family protein n=1 Tax=Haliea sp. TaxID=1932666 RepID=UPI0032EF2D7C